MTTTNISEEIKEIFEDPDIKFGSILRTLAMELSSNMTLGELNDIFQASRPLPSHNINGETFVAGYKGTNIILEGKQANAKLVSLKQNGDFCKAMFVFPTGQFLYWSSPKEELRIEQIVQLAQQMGNEFNVEVKHEIIPSTGEKHAKIVGVSF